MAPLAAPALGVDETVPVDPAETDREKIAEDVAVPSPSEATAEYPLGVVNVTLALDDAKQASARQLGTDAVAAGRTAGVVVDDSDPTTSYCPYA